MWDGINRQARHAMRVLACRYRLQLSMELSAIVARLCLSDPDNVRLKRFSLRNRGHTEQGRCLERGLQGRSGDHLSCTGGNHQDIVWLKLQVRSLGLKNFL